MKSSTYDYVVVGADCDDWVKLGATGWSYAEVLPYFKKSERNWRGETAHHGGAGPMGVTRMEVDRDPFFAAFMAMAKKIIPELHKRGVRVLPGGDYGFPHNPHGRNARDIELFVSEFGFTPAEALRAATQYGDEYSNHESKR